MSELQTKLPTDTWVVAIWDEYIQAIEDPIYKKAKGYYHNGRLRIEMSPVGSDHASDYTNTYPYGVTYPDRALNHKWLSRHTS
jgi:hypothetical protein